MRVGIRIPTSGPSASRAVLDAARDWEEAGADSLWVSDHVVQPTTIGSRYPYSQDGAASWDPTVPDLEALTVLAAVAAVTERVRLGTGVLVLPQRQPVLVAKQAASIAAIAPGRLVLGVGAGWLAEEFAALGADFAARGRVLDEWIEVLRDCWRGETRGVDGAHLRLEPGLSARPAPEPGVPILVGGMSGVALRRAARTGDGWIAQADADAAGVASVLAGVERLRREPRERPPLTIVARLSGDPARLDAAALAALADAGVAEVVVDAVEASRRLLAP